MASLAGLFYVDLQASLMTRRIRHKFAPLKCRRFMTHAPRVAHAIRNGRK
jgi:hypothetical protein